MSTIEQPERLLTRTDLLNRYGFTRRAADAVFRQLPVVVLPGYQRAMVRQSDLESLIEQSTLSDERVRHAPPQPSGTK